MAHHPKVLFVLTQDRYFWLHRRVLARAAKAAGMQVAVAASPGSAIEDIRSEGFEFFPLRLQPGRKNPLHELISILELVRLYRHLRPDLVHHISIKSVLWGTIAARISGVPGIVNAITGLGYAFNGKSARQRLIRWLITVGLRLSVLGRNARVTFENPDDEQLFIENRLCSKQQSRLILSVGVDTEVFSPGIEPNGIPTVTLPARMIWDKGVGEFVEAVRILKEREFKFKAVLAGAPDPSNPNYVPEPTLKKWTRENLVEWLGQVEDMPSLYQRSHIVCLPSSYREGVPMALVEAASCGRPIVTTNEPGCKETVKNGVSGLLVPPHDSEALAEALQRLLEDPAMRQNMGKAGRELAVNRFSKEIVIGKTFEVYRELLNGTCSKLIITSLYPEYQHQTGAIY